MASSCQKTPTPVGDPPLLPAPDPCGNYWLGPRPHGAAIFASGKEPRPVHPGLFFASAGAQGGILMSRAGIRYFTTPEEALLALNEVLCP
jgi:hypothetical protein